MALVDTVVSFTALGVAFVALFVSLAQLLQQYFGTAEGYRYCKKSVMGAWAEATHRHLRGREFRFEVTFETPEIFLTGPDVQERNGQILITGTVESRKETRTPLRDFDPGFPRVRESFRRTGPVANAKNEQVCWLPFLHWLHEATDVSLSLLEQTQPNKGEQNSPLGAKTIPALVRRERSWDFQPPDIYRPLAQIVVSDMVILARRMGMRWKSLRPEDGVMHAEGHHHSLTSTVSRSLGIVLYYSFSGRALSFGRGTSVQSQASVLHPDPDEIYIPSRIADMFGFGLIGGDTLLELDSKRDSNRFHAGSQWDIALMLDRLDPSGNSGDTLRTRLRTNPGFTFRMGDLTALITPIAHQKGSSLVQVPSPSENVHGFTTSISGRSKFREELREYMERNPVQQTPEYLEQVEEVRKRVNEKDSLLSLWPKPKGLQLSLICDTYDKLTQYQEWKDQQEKWIVRREQNYLDEVHDYYEDLTKYLKKETRYKYVELLAGHIRRCIFRPSSQPLQRYSAEEEISHWFREMERIGEDMEIVGKISREEIREAWIVMMFRACCWGACHFFVPGATAPPACYGSQLPVYIG